MSKLHVNDAVHLYMNDISSRLVARTGIPSDRYHLAKLLLQSLNDDPDFILQVDGATGQSETSGSVLERSVRCATGLRDIGVKVGDVIVFIAPNHLDLAVPIYAGLYIGAIVAPVDQNSTKHELQNVFKVYNPKAIFTQNKKVPEINAVLEEINIKTQIFTFDGDDESNFNCLLKNDTKIDEFRPEDFNPEETIAVLLQTSGTTGIPKAAAITHKNFVIATPYVWMRHDKFPTPASLVYITAPVQWITALLHFLFSPILRYRRLQTSSPPTIDHMRYLINTYKPKKAVLGPSAVTALLSNCQEYCDLSCFELIMVAGSAVPQDLINMLKELYPNTESLNVYGMTESAGIVFYGDDPAPGSVGKRIAGIEYKLVDIETEEVIDEPNKPGELLLKGPTIFKEYYNNPTETKASFSEGCWYRTGDMFYRDDEWNYFFVERIKLLLKYRNFQISPLEIEMVIRQHPGVLDVAVTGIPDPECGDLPIACIVRRGNCDVTAEEIKDLVKETLSDTKQLRGGVIFLDELPRTTSTKVNRKKVKEIVLNSKIV